MNIKQSTLAAAIAAGLAMGAAGQASANVYALSSLGISDLDITFSDSTGVVSPTITSFNFSVTNTANLNGSIDTTSDFCNALVGALACTVAPATPTLYAGAASSTGGGQTLIRADEVPVAPATYTVNGPGTFQYASADSVIRTGEVTGWDTTETSQIAETELQTGGFALSNAEIKSTTSLLFTFELEEDVGTGSMTLTFLADPDLYAFIAPTESFGASALANINVSFSLSQQVGGDGVVNWNPQGTATNDCSAIGGPTCSETADSEDLNDNVQTGTPGVPDAHSYEPNVANFQRYGITISGLTAGTWSLGLNALTSTQIQQAVPEPGMLALLGIGLTGMGIAARRRKQQA